MAANAPPAQWLPAVSKLHLSIAKLKASFREHLRDRHAGSNSHLRLSPTRDDIPRAVRRLRNSRDPPLLNGRNVEMSIHAQSLLSYAYETRARANFWALCASRDFTPILVAQQEGAHHHAGRWDVPRWTAGEEEEA